jgi:hypothetical protein
MRRRFFVRRTQNRELLGKGKYSAYCTWDIYRRIRNGDEFIAEFHDRRHAFVSARALNLEIKP